MTEAKAFMDDFISKLKSDDFIKDNQSDKGSEIDADFIAKQLLSYSKLLRNEDGKKFNPGTKLKEPTD